MNWQLCIDSALFVDWPVTNVEVRIEMQTRWTTFFEESTLKYILNSLIVKFIAYLIASNVDLTIAWVGIKPITIVLATVSFQAICGDRESSVRFDLFEFGVNCSNCLHGLCLN